MSTVNSIVQSLCLFLLRLFKGSIVNTIGQRVSFVSTSIV